MTDIMFSYDASAMQAADMQLVSFIKSNRYVTSWYQPFFGTFLIKTESARAFADSVREFLGNASHVISVMRSISTTGGTLPDQAWIWFNSDSTTLLPPPGEIKN